MHKQKKVLEKYLWVYEKCSIVQEQAVCVKYLH